MREIPLKNVVIPIGFIGACISIWSAYSEVHLADVLSSFRVQYVVASLVYCVFCILLKRALLGILFFGLAVFNFLPLFTYLIPAVQSEAATNYKVTTFNLLTENPQKREVEEFLLATDPDIFLLVELSQDWLDAMPDIRAKYPFNVLRPRDDNFGMALFSKHPILASSVRQLSTLSIPTIEASVRLQDSKGQPRVVTVLGVHPIPPVDAQSFRERNLLLQNASILLKEKGGSKILLGDFNLTPWSPRFKKLFPDDTWSDSGDGRGFNPTFPMTDPYGIAFTVLGIRIDHILFSKDLRVHSFSVGPDLGSDHLPVIAAFSIQ